VAIPLSFIEFVGRLAITGSVITAGRPTHVHRTTYGPLIDTALYNVHNAFDAGKSITWASGRGLGSGNWAPNGTCLSPQCHFTEPKKV